MKHLLNHLIHRHVLPLLLLPIAVSGCFCFAVFTLPEAFRSTSTEDRFVAVVFSLLGIFGTAVTITFLRAMRRLSPEWRVFELGRTGWIVLISIAWLAGVGCGIVILYESR